MDIYIKRQLIHYKKAINVYKKAINAEAECQENQ
jgi:hypothetical protein